MDGGTHKISADAKSQFTSTNFKTKSQTSKVHLTLAAPEHQEMNAYVKVTWRMLRIISHSLIVHARFLEACIHFGLMYTTDHIFPGLPIKDRINEYENPTTTFKLTTDTKHSLSHSHLLFCPCFVQKDTARVKNRR